MFPKLCVLEVVLSLLALMSVRCLVLRSSTYVSLASYLVSKLRYNSQNVKSLYRKESKECWDQRSQKKMTEQLTLRVRSQLGVWRMPNVKTTDSFGDLKQRLQVEHNVDLEHIPLTTEPTKAGSDPLPDTILKDSMTVKEAKLTNGHMLHLKVIQKVASPFHLLEL